MGFGQGLKKERILDNFTRGQIYGYLVANPGAYFNSIIRELDLNTGAVDYHLQVLEKTGYVHSYKDGHYKRYMPNREELPPLDTPKRNAKKNIAKVVEENPGISKSGIADKLGIHFTTLQHYLEELEEEGIMEVRKKPSKKLGRTQCFLP